MTNDEHLPDWDRDPLEEWAPTAAQRSRAVELWYLHASGHPDFPEAFRAYCDDVLAERSLPQTILAILMHGTTSLLRAHGRDATPDKLFADLKCARIDAALESWESR